MDNKGSGGNMLFVTLAEKVVFLLKFIPDEPERTSIMAFYAGGPTGFMI